MVTRGAPGKGALVCSASPTTAHSVRSCALKNDRWSIEEDDGRVVWVPMKQFTDASGLQIGDRVEVKPIGFVGAGVGRPYNWMIVRKIEDVQRP